ncbi:otospiralin isoform X1 [Chiroxiphia lanceolata]|uniref:otospiralin isoform X1 n=2 Tax=Chiroxiphia lanceolata TaxID=296741 RepID=UPI0013CF04CB|nr:otospiralin isoform X1 [Chiroxiphia lanceolata]
MASKEAHLKLPLITFQKHKHYLAEMMTFTGLFFFCMLMNMLTDARSIQDGDDLYQEAVALPYWPFSSNDFWSYVEYFWTLGAYNRINEMARAFFAQFPFGSHLGYHVPDHER